MAPGNALFVYSVPETPWHVVITDKCHHFYFNAVSKASVWQITETEEGLLEKLDYNELAVLFAKSRGFSMRGGKEKKEKEKKKVVEREVEEEEDEAAEGVSELEPEEVEVPHDLIQSVVGEMGPLDEGEGEKEEVGEKEVEEENVQQPIDGGVSLLQGYLSDSGDEDEGEEEAEVEATQEVVVPQDNVAEEDVAEEEEEQLGEDDALEGLVDVNAGLELLLSDDEAGEVEADEGVKETFKSLLSQHEGSFSKYDPWFLVVEDLVLVMAQEPAFYSLLDKEKETAFNEWVAESSSNFKQAPKGRFPTANLLFYQELQEHKAEIRKLPYVQYKEQFPFNTDGEEPDRLYRKLRTTLVDFADYEKKLKKGGYKGENLKVKKVNEFVANELASLLVEKGEHELLADLFFDKWIDLCNAFNLPLSMVESPENFILGDEKRYLCYKDALMKEGSD